MGDFLGTYGHLGVFEAHHLSFHWPPDTSPFLLPVLPRVSLLIFVHEVYLGAVDMTPHVGTIPTWLASYFLA